jgi:single-stranded-DNA-specific exonuclease
MAIPHRIERKPEGVSVAHKRIRLRTQNLELAESIASGYSLTPVTGRILAARGFKNDISLKNFINPSLKESLPEPTSLKNLDAGCALIKKSVEAGESIAICCDFDVDGLSGGSQVLHFFGAIGVQAKVFVPDRFEDGYGLNEGMIRDIAEQGFALVITIDYGTTNKSELTLARELGLKTIVIDHHHVVENPPADIFINPNQKGCGFADKILCAAGLAWYLLVALRRVLPQAKAVDVRRYLDLACLGTICDMVPLTGANRTIAKRGLEELSVSERVGLQALKNVMGVKGSVGCSDVSFGIGPRLNAAGRMVHGDLVIELLTTTDSKKASSIAERLNRLNLERQEAENQVKEIAVRMIHAAGELPAGIVVWEPDFHTGVIGIVAQRLVEIFYRPAAVMGIDKDGIYKGSVRGIKGLSVVDTLGAVSKHLIKFGGHEGAGGFSVAIENVEEFAAAFNDECARRLRKLETAPYVDGDTEVSLSEVDIRLIDELEQFAPFGMGNPNPVVVARGVRVQEVRVLKEAHLKATFTDGKRAIVGLLWRHTSHPQLAIGNKVDIAFRPDSNHFNGNVEIQAHLQAVVAAASAA